MNDRRIHIVINPASAGWKTRKRAGRICSELEQRLGNSCSFSFTSGPGDATALAARAVHNDARLVAAVGGDGTIQEVVNGFFSNGSLLNPECELGIISSGTGHGFAQSIGLPSSLKAQCELVIRGKSKSVDVGRVSFCDSMGKISRRYFVNECQLGIGGSVVRRVQEKHKKLGGSLAFGLGTLESVFLHENQEMAITLDCKRGMTGLLTGIVIANGAFTGGGMNLAPGACVDDGVFNLLVMHQLSLLDRLWNFPRIYSGSHLRSQRFSYQQVRNISVSSPEPVLVEADGEFLGTTPCTVEIFPNVLKVRSLCEEER